ncbi:MAG: hypothetical protein ABR526_10105 [Chthoniobacterales bacterium]
MIQTAPSPEQSPSARKPALIPSRRRFPRIDVFLISLVIAGAVLVLDIVTPRGVSVAALYVIPVILVQRAASTLYTVAIAMICAVLATIGIIVSPEIGVEPQVVLVDYAIIIVTLTATAVIGIISTRRAAQVQTMSKLLTMCSWTKKVKVRGEWVPIEDYLAKNLGVTITHGMTEESARHFLEQAGIEEAE